MDFSRKLHVLLRHTTDRPTDKHLHSSQNWVNLEYCCDMLHKLSLDANSVAIGKYMITIRFSFREQILLDYRTCEVRLSNMMAWPMKLK